MEAVAALETLPAGPGGGAVAAGRPTASGSAWPGRTEQQADASAAAQAARGLPAEPGVQGGGDDAADDPRGMGLADAQGGAAGAGSGGQGGCHGGSGTVPTGARPWARRPTRRGGEPW